jgi:hypothetical protein
MAYFNFSLPDHIEWISPRPILLIIGEHAHSRVTGRIARSDMRATVMRGARDVRIENVPDGGAPA